MQQIIIKKFNLSLFKSLVFESLETHNNLMLEIDKDLIRSLSLSGTTSLMKICYTKFADFDKDYDAERYKNMELFNLYVLKGDNFKKYLELYSVLSDVELKFNLQNSELSDARKIATHISIKGITTLGTTLDVTFNLTTEELMTNQVEDYSTVIDKLKVDTGIESQFSLNKSKYSETKDIIKKLHSTVSNNSNFVEFAINNTSVKIKDKVFDLEFKDCIVNYVDDSETIDFKILKSDFNILGKHNWQIFTNNTNDKIVLLTKIKSIEVENPTEIIVGSIITKTNSAQAFDNDGGEEDEDYGIDLAYYENI